LTKASLRDRDREGLIPSTVDLSRRRLAVRALSLFAALTALGLFATTISRASPERGPSMTNVRAALSPRAQVPSPGVAAPRAEGLFDATLRGTTLRWRLTFHGLTSAPSAAHLHLGRSRVGGPIVARLCARCRFGSSGTANLPDEVAAKLLKGTVYVDIHTPKNPRGEVRGQVAVGSVPMLEILSPRDGQRIVLPARVRYALSGFRLGPGAGSILAWVQGAQQDTRVELQLDGEQGLATLPDDKLFAGRRDLTFALARADGWVLRNPEANVTIYGLTVIGRR
jgi:hypothetical protein